MSVKPILLRDIKKSAAQAHQQQVGNGSYNRFSPLVTRDRAFSYGKRPLAPDDIVETAKKNPRLDKKIIFDQVRIHEKTITEWKKMVADNNPVEEGTEGQPIWKAIGMIVGVQEGLMSAVIDLEAAEVNTPCVSNAAGAVFTGGRRGGGGRRRVRLPVLPPGPCLLLSIRYKRRKKTCGPPLRRPRKSW
jgi:hypothetical protein